MIKASIKRTQSIRLENAQGFVEFLLILVILLVIVFGVLDLARIFNTLVVLSNASREAARFGTRNPADAAGMQQAAVDEAQNAGLVINTSDVSISCTDTDSPPDGCDRGFPVVVTVTHSFNFIFGQLFSANPLPLTRTAQMMVP
jgi:Flp pilus assembly protein TadG